MEPGLRVNGRLYPFPDNITIGESRMIKRLCGLAGPKLRTAMERFETEQDPDVALAVVWWCVHRANPNITIEELEELDWEKIEAEGGDKRPVADPKAEEETRGSSLSSAETSNGSADANSATIHSTSTTLG